MSPFAAALQKTQRLFPEKDIDRNSFLYGWLMGQRYWEFRRWFKEEYWEDAIRPYERAGLERDPSEESTGERT